MFKLSDMVVGAETIRRGLNGVYHSPSRIRRVLVRYIELEDGSRWGIYSGREYGDRDSRVELILYTDTVKATLERDAEERMAWHYFRELERRKYEEGFIHRALEGLRGIFTEEERASIESEL